MVLSTTLGVRVCYSQCESLAHNKCIDLVGDGYYLSPSGVNSFFLSPCFFFFFFFVCVFFL